MQERTLKYQTEKDALNRLQWIASDKYRWWFHVAFWLFIYIDQVLAILGLTDPLQFSYSKLLILLIIDLTTVYFNLYILIPAYFLQNKVFLYISFTVISILLNVEGSFLVKIYSSGDEFLDFPAVSTISILLSDLVYTTFMLATAIGANSLRRFIKGLGEIRELENTNLRTELKFLKDQINPHFLFNSLNNIYVQTRKRPKEASESILLLSDILRYQLYDCAQEEVLLEKEINYLKNYLQFDKSRGANSKQSFNIRGEVNNQMVAPYIFNTFVENAVKHGYSSKEGAFIDIDFDVKEDEIEFSIKNSVARLKHNGNSKGGIGLKNVQRRLELIYPGRHELNITEENDVYHVYLKLKLYSYEMHNR